MDFTKTATERFKLDMGLRNSEFLVYPDSIRILSVKAAVNNPEKVLVEFEQDLLKRPIATAAILQKGRYRVKRKQLHRQNLNHHPNNPPFGLIWQKPENKALNLQNLLEFVNASLQTQIQETDLSDILMTQNPITLRIKPESLFYLGTVNVHLL